MVDDDKKEGRMSKLPVKSEYGWRKGPQWGKSEGIVATLETDGYRFEVKKSPYVYPSHYGKAQIGYVPNTSRYQLIVDGKERGSKSPKLYSIVAEADAMLSWAKLARGED